ncbi:MAG: AMP-binding protein [Chloroflexi bacterium]|nr:AMP-binding protein [Chloroflexota bacterium]
MEGHMNTTDYLLQDHVDSAVALITPKTKYTYEELKKSILVLMDAFRAAGATPGAPIGILGSNSMLWVAGYLAAMKIGSIAVPFATRLPPDELAAQIKQIGCKVLCVDNKLRKKYSAAFDASLPQINEDALTADQPTASWVSEPAEFDENQDAAWMLTSGTTAKPRVVRITHLNIQANTKSIVEYLDLSHDDRILALLPFYYCFGTSLLHTHLRVGGSLVLGDSVIFPEKVLDLMAETACTGFAGVPTTFQMYLRNSSFPTRPLPALRKIQQAGGKLSTVLIEELTRSHPNAKVFVMYGQTEATARLSYLPPELLSTKLGSIGRGIPDVQLKVVNENGGEVKPGEVGEIVARGKNISPGYLDEPEINAEKFINGSLHTGDMATLDEDGYIYIVDRKSDFIKSYGNRVSSQEVEACIMEVGEVVATAVVGIPDPLRGEAIRAFVVLRSNAEVTDQTIINHCMQRLARYMVPRDVVFLQSLPTNQHGKVVKSELRKMEVT